MLRTSAFKAFTLLEVLITIGLLFVLFGVGADLLTGSFRVVRAQGYKSQATQAVHVALNRMCCELRECNNIVSLGSNSLVLQIVDPAYPQKAAPLSYNPYAPENTLNVTYSVNNQILQRSLVSAAGGTPQVETVVDGIVGLNCSYDPNYPSAVNVTVSVNDDTNGIQSLSGVVFPMAVVP